MKELFSKKKEQRWQTWVSCLSWGKRDRWIFLSFINFVEIVEKIIIDYYKSLSISTKVSSRDPYIGPEGFRQRDDICRGMIPRLIRKVSYYDLFITYFVRSLILLYNKININKLLNIHLKNENIFIVEMEQSNSLSLQPKLQ